VPLNTNKQTNKKRIPKKDADTQTDSDITGCSCAALQLLAPRASVSVGTATDTLAMEVSDVRGDATVGSRAHSTSPQQTRRNNMSKQADKSNGKQNPAGQAAATASGGTSAKPVPGGSGEGQKPTGNRRGSSVTERRPIQPP
jgi:phage gp29-like protein